MNCKILSEIWFGKEIDKDKLNQVYVPLYAERDDFLYLKAGIKDESLLSKFENAHYSKVLIEGLIFFKQAFNIFTVPIILFSTV